MLDPIQRQGFEIVVIGDRLKDQRAAQIVTRAQLFGTEPMRGDNTVVQWLLRRVLAYLATEGEPQRGSAVLVRPVIHAHESGRRKTPRGFLKGFANDRVKQRLAGLDMTGGLIDDALAVGEFFDHQKPVVDTHNRGRGEFGVDQNSLRVMLSIQSMDSSKPAFHVAKRFSGGYDAAIV